MKFEKLRDAALEASAAASAVLVKYYKRRHFKVREKKGAGLVTDADVEAEERAIKILRKRFPEFGILAEESGSQDRDGGRWILDPLDGTTNFVHGFPMFCVSIAAEFEGKIVAGVIEHPILEEIYVAVRGKGAFLNKRPLKVSKTRALRDSLLTTGFTYRKEVLLHREMQSFERLSSIARAVRRPGSAALDLAYTARGVFDGFWERGLAPWDVAAGSLLVEEAGGKVTGLRGEPFDVMSRELLATNGVLHKTLIEEIGS